MPVAPGRRTLERIRFGEYLRAESAITEEALLAALGDHWSNGGRLGAAIVRGGYMSEVEVERHAARYHSLDLVEI